MWPAADRHRAPVADFPPRWASAWGDDPCGLWADLVVGGVVQRMRWVEPGTFLMGSPANERDRDGDEGPQHEVTLTDGFWLADTPCTQALWQAVMNSNPSHFNEGAGAPQRPVERVTWDDVQPFLQALKAALPAGSSAALPTEAQWEYACRAGTSTAYHWGDKPNMALANFGQSVKATTPVKSYPANPWGLFDMHGNVWEWCEDDLRPYSPQPELNPKGGAGEGFRVLRGGSWDGTDGWACSASRGRALRGITWDFRGFRLALRSTSPVPSGPGP